MATQKLKIGFIGAGLLGGGLARLAAQSGYQVLVSNSRNPKTLFSLVGTIGPNATAGTPQEAAAFGDIVVVSIPLGAIGELPIEALAGKTVIDTNNYYAARDGQLPALDTDETTSSELLAAQLPQSTIVKAFNAIGSADLVVDGLVPAGTPNRRALPLAGDDAAAKAVVIEFMNQLGFDAQDIGALAEGRRIGPDTPAYCVRLNQAQLRQALA